MSLRPRYSLLTLLVLTALVAGGVKLWRGPHHVVERVHSMQEIEYSYIRDWRGNKIQQGPFVLRAFDSDGKLDHSEIYYRRDGMNTCYRRNPQMTMSYLVSRPNEITPKNFYKQSILDNPLSTEELQTFQQVIKGEKIRVLESNSGCELLEGYWPEFFPEKLRGD